MRNWAVLTLALLAAAPALALRTAEFLGGVHVDASPLLLAFAFGIAVVGGAYLLSLGAELAQMETSQALALALVALVAVMPEYAVDFVFAWKAGAEAAAGIPFEEQRWVHLAVANMTGANRLLIGLGWPTIIAVHYWRQRRSLDLTGGLSLELLVLGLATVWAFTVFLTPAITLWHAVGFVLLFGLYIWASSRGRRHEPELVGPAQRIALMGRRARLGFTFGLFLVAGIIIIASAEPFAENLIVTGDELGIDEFLLAQWIAPMASESPEVLVAIIFALRGNALAALTTLVSSKVNQWTLLVGTLPVVYSISLGSASDLPIDSRQQEEVVLTAAQSLFAIVLLANKFIGWRGAAALAVLFLLQLFSPFYPSIPVLLPDPENRHGFTILYFVVIAALLAAQPGRARAVWELAPATLRLVAPARGNRR